MQGTFQGVFRAFYFAVGFIMPGSHMTFKRLKNAEAEGAMQPPVLLGPGVGVC